VTPRPPASDRRGVERAVADLIRALGLDEASEPELRETPARVADLCAEVLAGLDPGAVPELATFPHLSGGSRKNNVDTALRQRVCSRVQNGCTRK